MKKIVTNVTGICFGNGFITAISRLFSLYAEPVTMQNLDYRNRKKNCD